MGKPFEKNVWHSKSGKQRFITLVSLGSHCGVLADHACMEVVVQSENDSLFLFSKTFSVCLTIHSPGFGQRVKVSYSNS